MTMNPNARLIEAEAERCMEQSLHPELKRVRCDFRHGILTLYGVVSNFHLRQIAQELIRGIEGIQIIDNQIDCLDANEAKNVSFQAKEGNSYTSFSGGA